MRKVMLLVSFVFAACAGNSSGDGVDDGDGDDGDDMGGPETCAVSATLSQQLQDPWAGQGMDDGGQFRVFEAVLSEGEKPDLLEIGLYDGYGVFAGGAARTGSFTISGTETSPSECGLCVTVLADLDDTAGPGQMYMAQSGTVEITSITGNLTGSLSNLTFKQIDLATDAVTGDCASSLASAAFDAPMEMITDDGTM